MPVFFLKISWKSVLPFLCNAAKRHGLLRKSVEKSCVQGVQWNILKMFPIVPCIKSHLPWKFHENPFSHFSVIMLTDRQTNRQSNGQQWKHNLRHGGGNYRNWPRYGLRWSGWYCHQAQHELCRPSRGRLRPRRPAQRVLCLMAVPPMTAQTV